MDSLTQAVLGAGIAGACAPAGHRRRALLAGAVIGTLPDLDVFIDHGDPVANFTYHRGFSHSLIVLAPFSVAVWAFLRRFWSPVRESPRRWLAAIVLVLLTHPLLDAHTAYGTQLFWPLPSPPVSWSTIFIIDPLYTVWLVLAVLFAALLPRRAATGRVLAAGLLLSTLYLGWTWVAKGLVERTTRAALAEMGLDDRPVFTTPSFFNTLLWRIVVLTDDGYLEGFDSLLLDEPRLRFHAYPSDLASMNAASNVWAVGRLRWMARDFVAAAVEDEGLVITDLRMGQAPWYSFSHVVALRGNPHWKPIPTRRIPRYFPDTILAETWRRIREE